MSYPDKVCTFSEKMFEPGAGHSKDRRQACSNTSWGKARTEKDGIGHEGGNLVITDKKIVLAIEDSTALSVDLQETLMLLQRSRLVAGPVEKLNIDQPERHDKESQHHR